MKLRMRPLAETDGPLVLAWRNRPDIAANMYTDHVIGPEEHERWLAAALSLPDRRFWIIVLDDQPVGLANLARIDQRSRKCEWAFYLADPNTRGRGAGAVVEYLILNYVFETLGLHKLWCEVLLGNEGVWRLHQSFGFKQEAHFRSHVCKAGVFYDVLGLGLLSTEWAAGKAACEERLRARGVDFAAVVFEA